ncbi:TetR/AcrR family transcriptional regulator [Actinoalloteichus sp. AHMU CJ021]|uniref:Transcriptional regulator, TetR family n=1 Tax=Actinoalloteichus caeruleus DSM 43889 TaxID=1120930 RepID=A0ABT1JQ42_ACTCY|nr:TetR/AcrR family transcriptional regulator [Actinoalloteichus caeruleus]AUS80394.1 TetR/AcrR family transcriptional regulator [Actinoalloteichus sp. AHMU CJ021]MCP2334657.1 transcriptional regulator, TetR family [Actinoalloteichus caeruleus DSM 43889]
MRETPRRADARRNRERISRAALAAFSELPAGGPTDLRLEDVAARAGVGVATVYRLFGGRGGLVRAAFRVLLADEVWPLAAVAATASNPGPALRAAIVEAVERLVARPALVHAARDRGAIDLDLVENHLGDLRAVLVAAQHAGEVRPDAVLRDLAAILVMTLATAHDQDGAGVDRARSLALLLDGLRPGGTALPTPEGTPQGAADPPASALGTGRPGQAG